MNAHDADEAVLERLAHGLERGAVVFRQLVEEEHAVVREADLAGLGFAAAADESDRADRVMRRAERTLEQQPAVRGERAGGAVDARDLERLLERHIRQDAGQAAGHHRLAAAGRADHQHVVAAGGGDFQRALGAPLPAHVGKVVRRLTPLEQLVIGRDGHGRDRVPAAQMADGVTEVMDGQDVKPLHAGGLARILRREQQRAHAALARGHRHGERAAHAEHAAGEGELTDRRDAGKALRVERAAGGEDGERDGQVIGRALLLDVGGREVDGQPRDGEQNVAGGHRGAHALTALLDGGVGQADELIHGHALGAVGLHGDGKALDAGEAEA